jgi:predicted transcriptional regulator
MPRKYTNVELLSEEVFQRKVAGETNREIAESYGLSQKQIKELVTRRNHKARLIANGYIPRPKGRPRKNIADEKAHRNNELAELRMKVELLQNFLSEVGRKWS